MSDGPAAATEMPPAGGPSEDLPTALSAPGGAEMMATIAICTRGRPALLARALRAALACAPETSVLVVDQSDDPRANEAAIASESSSRVRHVVDHGRGASRARNLALFMAHTPVVVFIDDDCEAQPGAVQRLVQAFEDEPGVGVAFGTVTAPAVTGGFIPTYYPPRARVLRGRLAKLRDGGIGALMAVRRDAALPVGGFDERVGAGSDLAACEDGELAYRLLRAGWGLAHVPAASVMHHGFRRWSDGRRYSYETYRGIGAAYATHLRGGDPGGLALLAQQFAVVLSGMVRAALQREPIGLARLLGLGAGVVMGVRMQPWGTAPRRPAAWSQ